MRIHGVSMEKIMLHLPDHPTEGGEIGSENAIGIHLAQGTGLTPRGFQDFHKQRSTADIAPKVAVDQLQMFPDQPDGISSKIADTGFLDQHQKSLKKRERLALEDIRVGGL